MLSLLLGVFAVAAAAPSLTRLLGSRAHVLLALAPAGATAFFLAQLPALADGGDLSERIAWVPQLGIDLSLHLDGFSALFALMITGIGTAVVLYGGGYLARDPMLPRFHLVLLAFMGAMLGVVLADDLITLFVFWELTSLTSYFLVAFKHERAEARKSALQALLVTGTGGLAMLAGFLLIGQVVGTTHIGTIVASGDLLRASPLYLPAVLLVAAGAFTKSAQWPFHFWLPNAMAAPTPVSAYLHSATMVKAGVYLLARLAPALGGTAVWFWLLVAAGTATIVAASLLALLQRDSKRLLAYSTLIALGTLVMLIGIGDGPAIKAMVVFLLAHALYKAPLFMTAGSVDHEVGSRDVTRLRGLGRVMPWTFAAALAAGVSAAGLPPLLGFLAKEVAIESLLPTPWLVAVLVAAGAVMIVVVALVAWRPFTGVRPASLPAPHEAPWSMWLGPLLLAALGLVFGLAPWLLQDTLMRPAAAAVLGRSYDFELKLWHGFNAALMVSIATIALGALLAATWPRWHEPLRARLSTFRPGPAAGYDLALTLLTRIAAAQTRWVQPEDLRTQVFVIVSVTVGLTGAVAFGNGVFTGLWRAPTLGLLHEVITLLAIIFGVVGAVRARTRMAAITSLGVVGFGIALVFVSFGAPDLAITQFLVETLIVIIVALVLVRLPSGTLASAGDRVRPLAALVAIAGGALMSALLLAVTSAPFDATLTRYFEAESYPSANGRNVVNVILVDFRAIDTLGEITVLLVAATGVAALVRRLLAKPERSDARAGVEGEA